MVGITKGKVTMDEVQQKMAREICAGGERSRRAEEMRRQTLKNSSYRIHSCSNFIPHSIISCKRFQIRGSLASRLFH